MSCNSDYNSAILGNCSRGNDYVKDQLCCQFSIAAGADETIYEAINETVIASFILKNSGTFPFDVTATNSAGTTVLTETLAPGQCLMRTIDNLGAISIAGPVAPAGPAKGELDIVVRYQLDL